MYSKEGTEEYANMGKFRLEENIHR